MKDPSRVSLPFVFFIKVSSQSLIHEQTSTEVFETKVVQTYLPTFCAPTSCDRVTILNALGILVLKLVNGYFWGLSKPAAAVVSILLEGETPKYIQ